MQYIKNSDSIGILHDSRKDVRTLARMINILLEKVNGLVEANNNLEEKIQDILKKAEHV